MADLTDLKAHLHRSILKGRSVIGIISSQRFERIWDSSTEDQKEEVAKLIKKKDKKRILEWVCFHPSIEVGEMGVASLKELAKKHGVKNYSRLLKSELVRELEKIKR